MKTKMFVLSYQPMHVDTSYLIIYKH